MKFTVKNIPMTLEPGQLWRHKASDEVYLAVRITGKTYLVTTDSFDLVWANSGGFNGAEADFEYTGLLTAEDN